jgi:hypothetical protein
MRHSLALLALPLALAACVPAEPIAFKQQATPHTLPPLWLTEAQGPLPVHGRLDGQEQARIRCAVDFSAATDQPVRARDMLGRELVRVTPMQREGSCVTLLMQQDRHADRTLRACQQGGAWRL